jgi:lipopolysaccharide/colanic/teichoic acid biosynthesis glycosyltransferase
MRYPAMVIASPGHRNHVLDVVKTEGRYHLMGLLDAQALDRDMRDDTFEQLQNLGIAEVFVSWDAVKNRMFLGQRFQALGLTLRVIPDRQSRPFSDAKLHLLNEEVPCITFAPPVVAGLSFWVKRVFDISFAIAFLILASPIYLAIAIAVYLDSPGPIFYKQTRVGLHGQPFKVWKFRSMVNDADKLQTQLEQQNQTKDGVLFKVKDDPRITRVGHFIRQYSLDELPQIFNVLLGEMSFVGPRPLPLRLRNSSSAISSVKMCCLASQACGRFQVALTSITLTMCSSLTCTTSNIGQSGWICRFSLRPSLRSYKNPVPTKLDVSPWHLVLE